MSYWYDTTHLDSLTVTNQLIFDMAINFEIDFGLHIFCISLSLDTICTPSIVYLYINIQMSESVSDIMSTDLCPCVYFWKKMFTVLCPCVYFWKKFLQFLCLLLKYKYDWEVYYMTFHSSMARKPKGREESCVAASWRVSANTQTRMMSFIKKINHYTSQKCDSR